MTSIDNTIDFLENIDDCYTAEYFYGIESPPIIFKIIDALKSHKQSPQDNGELIEELEKWEKSSWNDNLFWLYLDFMHEKGIRVNIAFSVKTIINFLM